MIVVIPISIVSVFLAYLSSYRGIIREGFFKIAFYLITFLQVIHFDYGNDYMAYYNEHALYQSSFREFLYFRQIGHGAFKDMGWAFVSRFFPGKLGFFLFIAVLSIIQNIIYYKLIKEYVQPRHRWKALAIYLFTTSCYLFGFSGLRQGIAIAICISAIVLSNRNRLVSGIILVLFAASLHGSALVILPFLMLSKLRFKNGRKYGTIMVSITLTFFLSVTVVSRLFAVIFSLVPFLERKYGHYVIDMAAAGKAPGLGFALNLLMYLILFYFMFNRFNTFSKEYKVFILLTCISLVILPFQLNISGLISRVGMYFSVFQILVVPTVYSKIRDRYMRVGATMIYSFMMLYGYYEFFFVTEWSAKSYRNFKTIFSVLFK
ncbi:MAG: EpsG family protein [Hungatella sp.]|nr:EpsG family protein [Hungatella sp.]